MKKFLLVLLANCIAVFSFAQKEIKYSTIYYNKATKETDQLTILVDNIIGNDAETKFKLKITNKTGDFIMIKTEEFKIVVDGKEIGGLKEKPILIRPNDFETKVVNFKVPGMNKVKNYTLMVNGISKVPTDSKPIVAPEFKMPPAQNEFKAGAFTCTLGKWTKETQGTDIKFNVAYNGDKVGFIFPNKVSAGLPDGNDYAVSGSKAKPIMLMKGETDSFWLHWDRIEGGKVTDMQKVTMMLKWPETFMESTPVKMNSEQLEITFDEATSNDKGR